MNPTIKPNTENSENIDSKNQKLVKNNSSVITVRINSELNDALDKLKDKLGNSKADLIRNYLGMSQYIIKQKNSI